MAKILVACEESQIVTIELRKYGHEAFSCDIIDCSGGKPEWHLKCDVRDILGESWDAIIAFPPCTDLAISGTAWFKEKQKDGRQQKSIDFFMLFANHGCKNVAIENPVGIMSTVWKKPTQIIQPYHYGDEAMKTTCLWLKGLPKLIPTNMLDKESVYTIHNGKKVSKWKLKHDNLPHSVRAKMRSKTFPGIAKAMGKQWGEYLCMYKN